MAKRKKKVYPQIRDVWGDLWNVTEERATIHPFVLYFGIPVAPGKVGGARVILTGDLALHMENHRHGSYGPTDPGLPINRDTVCRLRRLLGHHRLNDRPAWWQERLADLQSLTFDDFAARHGVSPSAASAAHALHFGRRVRPANWWREEPARSLLLGPLPRQVVAERLDLSIGVVSELRTRLRTSFLE